jgi:hypothetical protein
MFREQMIEVLTVESRQYSGYGRAISLGCFPSVGLNMAVKKTEITTLIVTILRKRSPIG